MYGHNDYLSSNDFIRDCTFNPDLSLMVKAEVFEYLKDVPIALFEFNRSGYIIFKSCQVGYIFINSNDDWAFWSRSMVDIVDVLILLSKEQFAIVHPEFDCDVKSYLLLDPVEKYCYADSLIDICYCESAKILRVNKFIKEYGYKPLELEIHY